MKESPPAALVRPAPGERTISNAEVPLPRSPLSLAAGTARREPLSFGFAANHGFCPRGCKGRSPLHEITLILPLPAGKGGGGMGAGKKTKGRVGRRQTRQAPPTDSGTARSAGDQPGKPPRWAPTPQVQPVPLPAQARGCKGRSPLHKKTKNLPLPRRGRGLGGWGQERKLRAGLAGDQKGKPPSGFRNGNVSRRPAGQAPPTGTCLASSVSAAGGLMQGCRGRSPPLPPSPIKTARNPRPQSGRGRSRPARSGSSGNADYISIPMFLFSASSSEHRQQRQRSAEPQRHLRR